MMMNILAALDPYRQASVGESALYAFLGYAVVFAGILFLIFVVWFVGKILTSTEKRKKAAPAPVKEIQPVTEASQDELSEETVAVIMAALAAYYEKENKKCEFTVKRIKRL